MSLLLAPPSPANAADIWNDPYPGIRYLKRTEKHQVYHVVIVRLGSPYFSVRATKPGEKGQTTSSFAKVVNAAVAVNGDWFSPRTRQPAGLAIGDGKHWPETKDDKDHAFIACDAQSRCEIDQPQASRSLSRSWKNVVGGNGSLLIRNGKPRSAEDDSSCGSLCKHGRPRTAVGLGKGKGMLFLLVAEGGRPGIQGPTLRQVALVLQDLGAHSAMSFEGGPSSTLVIAGKRVNELPSEQRGERVVSNHFGVIYHPPKDGCGLAQRANCAKYGCGCVDGECKGGFCPGDGCTVERQGHCRYYGCPCVDMQCSGGLCPGTGCTPRMMKDCKKLGCHCVDGRCTGGKCPGTGCTAKRIKDCAKHGCACVSGECTGGFCPGTGCEEKQLRDCKEYGCSCVDGKCSGGHCPGTGCTAKQTKECWTKGCGCADGRCAGGKCKGSGCTMKQVQFCSARNCGCSKGKCTGGKCLEAGCASCSCELRRAPTKASAMVWITALLVALMLLRHRFGVKLRRRDDKPRS